MPDLTDLLNRGWDDPAARNEAARRLLDVLRGIARARVGRGGGDPLVQPTDLAHRAFVKIFAGRPRAWKERAQFYILAWKVIGQMWVSDARRDRAQKRGGRWTRVAMSDAGPADRDGLEESVEWLDLLAELRRRHGAAPALVLAYLRAGHTRGELPALLRDQDGLDLSPRAVSHALFQALLWLRQQEA